ncbi:hypothetical protein [Bradyrhizobium sp. LHD-71]|uniref:hypothetical protein n=1 Tax=Bradyrhizobium sp. LHD-71 TaxID=3072141 RepID=UPI00280FC66C|nr:hypothetical protein [Bradyrhizobium sp. LHD-71]MDQ8728154.1 hypothetical protein [Bradyrhizobium sp. LHD-71]
MKLEQEYRDLLHNAQKSTDAIMDFLTAIEKAPGAQTNASIKDLVRVATSNAKTLKQEIDQIWDEFKRT